MDYIIAIDGPSGVGKSTIAKKLSKILKINYIDTGAMYRAIAFKLISNNIPLDNHNKIKEILLQIPENTEKRKLKKVDYNRLLENLKIETNIKKF